MLQLDLFLIYQNSHFQAGITCISSKKSDWLNVTVNVFLLNQSTKYEMLGMFAEDSKVPAQIFNGDLVDDLKDIFEDIPI